MDDATQTMLGQLDIGLPKVATPETQRVILYLEERYQHYVDGLDTIIAGGRQGRSIIVEDADGDRMTIAAGDDLHSGVVIGLEMALQVLGPFPLRVVDLKPGQEGEPS